MISNDSKPCHDLGKGSLLGFRGVDARVKAKRCPRRRWILQLDPLYRRIFNVALSDVFKKDAQVTAPVE